MSEVSDKWAIYGPPIRGRSCGSCKLCCTLLPVDLPGGKKLAGDRCKHLCSKGCSIYARRPKPCEYWSCRWLFDEQTAGMRRPDQAGYVVDAMYDEVIADGRIEPAVQVWCDPARPQAYKDPALLAYLEPLRMLVMVRYSSSAGFCMVPPTLSAEGVWFEVRTPQVTEVEMQRRLAEVRG